MIEVKGTRDAGEQVYIAMAGVVACPGEADVPDVAVEDVAPARACRRHH